MSYCLLLIDTMTDKIRYNLIMHNEKGILNEN